MMESGLLHYGLIWKKTLPESEAELEEDVDDVNDDVDGDGPREK